MSCTKPRSEAADSTSEPHCCDQRCARRSLLMSGLGAATLGASFVYAPLVHHGPVLCPFRLLTGLPCPGCGLTRSFCAIAHGNLWEAFAQHALGPILFLGLVVGVPLLLVQGVTRRPIVPLGRVLFSMKTGWAVAIALFSFHAIRLGSLAYAGTIFNGTRNSLLGVVLHWLGA